MIIEEEVIEFPADMGITDEELEYDHLMDISGSVYARMQELGMSQRDLAAAADMDPAQISRIIKGSQNITIRTLAKLESVLDFRLDAGFRYHSEPNKEFTASVENPCNRCMSAALAAGWINRLINSTRMEARG